MPSTTSLRKQRSSFQCHSIVVENGHGFFSIQLLLPLKTQEDLDQAITTLGSSSGVNGLLRILLKTPKNNPVSAEATKLITERLLNRLHNLAALHKCGCADDHCVDGNHNNCFGNSCWQLEGI